MSESENADAKIRDQNAVLEEHHGTPGLVPEEAIAATDNAAEPVEAGDAVQAADPAQAEDDTGSLNAFAASVKEGLKGAGLDLDDEGETAEPPVIEAQDEKTEETPAYFAGWGAGAEIAEEAVAPEPAPAPERPKVSLNGAYDRNAGLNAAPQEAPVMTVARQMGSDLEGFVDKHDALADAVQSALLSVYGTPQTRPANETLRRQEPVQAETPVAAGDDGMTPQDVILNYFDYQVARPSTDAGNAAKNRPTFGNQSAPRVAPQDTSVRQATVAEFKPRPAPPAKSSSDAARNETSARYEGPPAFPPPATIDTASLPQADKSQGRLIGAAGIGLIGGIAIAATMAVFVINSYGPTQPLTSGDDSAPARRGASKADSRSEAVPGGGSVVRASNVSGEAGQPLALAISVQSPKPSEQTLVSISSVPEGFRLSVGVDAGSGTWLLPPKRLAGLAVTAPQDRVGTYRFEAQLLDGNARTPLSEKTAFDVNVTAGDANPQAVAAAPQAAPAPNLPEASAQSGPQTNTAVALAQVPPAPGSIQPPVTTAPATASLGAASLPASAINEAEDLIREGNKRMREGDIMQARALYARAVVNGDADAALAMGRSYDPIYFERLETKNAEPDAAKAFDWYRQAMDRGATQTARMRIDNLQQYLNR
jgi:hypothetical protein